MIDEKKLVEKLNKITFKAEVRNSCYKGARTEKMLCYEDVMSIINKQPKFGEWIPVSKRLPPKPEEYHMHEKSYIVQERYVLEPYTAYWDGEKWTNILDDVLTDIIAWQPLPERYQNDEQEE